MGNLDTLRDWCHARDNDEMQWLMLQKDKPNDYVIATGTQYSVRHAIEASAKCLGLELEWRGEQAAEVGVVVKSDSEHLEPGMTIVRVDPRYYRPTEVDDLLGDPSRAKRELGWEPTTTFEELIEEMTLGDLELSKRDSLVTAAGYRAYTYNE